MSSEMRGQLGEAAESALAEVMFDSFDIRKVVAVIEPH